MITAADLAGHWRRAWIETPSTRDDRTRVHWLQAGAAYADIRVPADRPDPGAARRLADLPPSALAELLRAEAFAGSITVKDGICTWTRRINFAGFPVAPDIGQLSWGASAGTLIEDGVESPYRELWCREDGPGLRAAGGRDGGREIRAIFGAEVFLIAIGDPRQPAQRGLIDALSAARAAGPDLALAFESAAVYGHWMGDRGIADLSTNPFDAGRTVVTRRGDTLIWIETRFDGTERHHGLTLEPERPAAAVSC